MYLMAWNGRNPNGDSISGTKSLVQWYFIELAFIDGICWIRVFVNGISSIFSRKKKEMSCSIVHKKNYYVSLLACKFFLAKLSNLVRTTLRN